MVFFLTGCPSIELNLPQSDLLYCTMDEHCLGMECCLTLELFDMLEFGVNAFVRVDIDNGTLTFGINSWRHVIQNDLLSGGRCFE